MRLKALKGIMKARTQKFPLDVSTELSNLHEQRGDSMMESEHIRERERERERDMQNDK